MSQRTSYIVYCDESADHGPRFSNFYGGLIMKASNFVALEQQLHATKTAHGMTAEMKWTKVSEQKLPAYKALVDTLFDAVDAGGVRIRIMFTQNIHEATGLTGAGGRGGRLLERTLAQDALHLVLGQDPASEELVGAEGKASRSSSVAEPPIAAIVGSVICGLHRGAGSCYGRPGNLGDEMKIPMTCLVVTIALAGCGGGEQSGQGNYVDMLAPLDEANPRGVTIDPSFAGCVGQYRNFEPRQVVRIEDGPPCHHDISDYATRRVFLR